MWIKTSGMLTENVVQVSTSMSTHLLILGELAAVVDTGVSGVHDRLDEELRRCMGEGGSLDFILLTHAHFDHVGGIPYLRKAFPDAVLLTGRQTAEILGRQEILDEFYEKNLACAQAMKIDLGISKEEWVGAMQVDRIIGDGDALDLGDDVEVKLIAVPGHTEDCVAYFVRPDAALACGEGVGAYSGRDKIASCFTSSYGDYLESLDKLAGLDVRILGLPHGGVLTGELVPKFFVQARQEAERFAQSVHERIEQGELTNEIYESLLPEWRLQNICPEGPFVEEQKTTLQAMIKAVAAVET